MPYNYYKPAPTFNDGFGMGSSVGNLISMLLGQDDTSGGYEVDPVTGKVTYVPQTGKKGFFGKQSREKAKAYNQQAGAVAYAKQIENEGRIEELKKKAELEEDAAVKAFERTQKAEKEKREAAFAEKYGFLATPENLDAYNKFTRGQAIANAANDLGIKHTQNAQQINYNNSDFGANKIADARTATLATPGVANAATLMNAMKTDQGGMTPLITIPGINDNLGMITGPTQNEQTYTYGGVRDPKTGEIVGEQSGTFRSTTPGSIRQPGKVIPLNPGFKNSVLSQGSGAIPTTPNAQQNWTGPDFNSPEDITMLQSAKVPGADFNSNVTETNKVSPIPADKQSKKGTTISTKVGNKEIPYETGYLTNDTLGQFPGALRETLPQLPGKIGEGFRKGVEQFGTADEGWGDIIKFLYAIGATPFNMDWDYRSKDEQGYKPSPSTTPATPNVPKPAPRKVKKQAYTAPAVSIPRAPTANKAPAPLLTLQSQLAPGTPFNENYGNFTNLPSWNKQVDEMNQLQALLETLKKSNNAFNLSNSWRDIPSQTNPYAAPVPGWP